MARIDLAGIGHVYDDAGHAVRGIDATFDDGGAYALLGPSGCGKTTLLSIISGLLTPSEGRVEMNGADVTTLPIRARNTAQVFQFPVVYERMTVRENLAFPLRNRGVPARERDARVAEIIEVLGLGDWAEQRAGRAPADVKQKISLGRGLVRDDVAAVLLDEPLTAIDPERKWGLRRQIKALHRRMHRTMIYVTHDQSEALTFAERVAVMHSGRIVQTGTPAELFESPRHTFVGRFIGAPGMNVLPAAVSGATARVGGHALALKGAPREAVTGPVEIGVRPEDIGLGREGAPVTIARVDDLGRRRIVHARLDGLDVRISVGADAEIPAEPRLTFDAARIGVFVDSWRVPLEGDD